MSALPVDKGRAKDITNGHTVQVHFLAHDKDAGETTADDCFVTTPEKPGRMADMKPKHEDQCGLWTPQQFKERFQYIKK